MKVESVVYLAKEELDAIQTAYDVLESYHSKSITVDDPHINIRLDAQTAYEAIDAFLCNYSEEFEK